MPELISARAERAISEKIFPGCVVGVVNARGERTVLPYGSLAYADSQKVAPETIYDVASVTKSIPLASIVPSFIAEEKLALSDLVRTYIPELRNDHAATIEDLLLYRVQGLRMSELAEYSSKDIVHCVFQAGFTALPGESHYSNLPAFLLGIILERISGKTLDVLAQERIFTPLEMKRTTFFPSRDFNDSDIAPTEMDQAVEIRGIVHDESARIFAREGKAVGHAGLFSTVPDLLVFLRNLLQGNYPDIVGRAQKGLGWQLNEGYFMGRRFGPRTFGKTGFTGTSIVCDTDRGIAVVILANRTYPVRSADAASLSSPINIFRRDIADIVFDSLRREQQA